jgi:hypothetical protein
LCRALSYTARRVKIFFVIFIWMLMAAVLAAGIVLAVKGSLWLLAIGTLCFILAIGKIGCLTH